MVGSSSFAMLIYIGLQQVKQQKMNEEFILVSDITDIELNQSQTVQLGDENILICHTETGVYAVEDKCIPLIFLAAVNHWNFITCPVHEPF